MKLSFINQWRNFCSEPVFHPPDKRALAPVICKASNRHMISVATQRHHCSARNLKSVMIACEASMVVFIFACLKHFLPPSGSWRTKSCKQGYWKPDLEINEGASILKQCFTHQISDLLRPSLVKLEIAVCFLELALWLLAKHLRLSSYLSRSSIAYVQK